MEMTDKDKYLEFAKKVAQAAGGIMKKYFRSTSLATTWKEDNTPVTMADHEINQLVINEVKACFPKHGVLGEEGSYQPDQPYLWVVDPIDGTGQFDLGMPNSTFCMALVIHGQPQVSVIFDPYTNRLFSATKGQGAFCNDRPLKLANADTLKNKYVFMPGGTREQPGLYKAILGDLHQQGCKILFIPSFNYLSTLVLEGSGLACLMGYGSPWDAAAIALIAEEAGYKVSDIDGTARVYSQWGQGIIVAHPMIYDRLIEGLKDAHHWH